MTANRPSMNHPLLRVLVLCGLLAATQVSAQTPSESLPPETSIRSTGALPPLDRILEAVRVQSPRLRVQRALVEKNRALVARSKSSWSDQVTVGLTSTYGSYGNVLLDELNLGAQAGLSVRLSLFELIGRRHDTEVYRQELAMSEAQGDAVWLDEQADAITLYHQLLLADRLIAIRSGALESARVHEQMAERQFAQGDITVGEVSRVSEITSRAESDYEQARVEFLAAWTRLESLAGVPLASLAEVSR